MVVRAPGERREVLRPPAAPNAKSKTEERGGGVSGDKGGWEAGDTGLPPGESGRPRKGAPGGPSRVGHRPDRRTSLRATPWHRAVSDGSRRSVITTQLYSTPFVEWAWLGTVRGHGWGSPEAPPFLHG